MSDKSELTHKRSSYGSNSGQRVLIYTSAYNIIDGVTVTIRKIEEAILATGGHVCIISTRSGAISNTNLVRSHANRTVHFLEKSIPIPLVSVGLDVQYHVGFAICAADKRIIHEFAPNIVHITVPDACAMSIMDYARQTNIPIMGTFHSNYLEYFDHYPGLGWCKPVLGGLMKHSYGFLQTLYVPTPSMVKKLTSDIYSLDRCTNLQLWGRGYDIQKFSPKHRCNHFRKQIGASPEDVVVCIVSRLVPEKSPHIFANVIKRLNRYHCTGSTAHNGDTPNNSKNSKKKLNYRGLVIGIGASEYLFKNLPNTYCAGWMSGHELSVAYASSDIFLFPSAVETFGNVTLEAAGSGLSLVVESACSSHLVNDGVNGYSCAAFDEDAFYEATLKLILLENKERKLFGQHSRELSLQYEQQKVMKRMTQNYSDIIDEFHNKYKGRHSNRDKMLIQKNPDYFIGGTIAYPPGMGLMELFFFVLFSSVDALVWLDNGSCKRMKARIGFALKKMKREERKAAPIADASNNNGIGLSHSPDTHHDTAVPLSPQIRTSVALGDGEFCVWLGKFCIDIFFRCARLINGMKQFRWK